MRDSPPSHQCSLEWYAPGNAVLLHFPDVYQWAFTQFYSEAFLGFWTSLDKADPTPLFIEVQRFAV